MDGMLLRFTAEGAAIPEKERKMDGESIQKGAPRS